MRSSVVEPQNPRSVGTRSSNAPQSDTRPPYPQQRVPKPSRYETKSSFIPVPTEGWLAILLLAVSVYCVVFSIVAANWVSHSFILFWSTAAGLLLGLVVAKIHRFPQAIL